jgi:uncharacterized protein (DUF1697 family)
METYIAFLRAINVGGHAVVKMDALKKIFESAGMKNVKTYIQSGNVIFDSTEKDEKKLQKKIEKKLLAELKFEVPVLLRTYNELQKVSEKDPFKKFKNGKEQMVYVAFFHEEPGKEIQKTLEALCTKLETYKTAGRELFCLCKRDTKGQTNFSNNLIEKKSGMTATTRNMNTINKMISLKS